MPDKEKQPNLCKSCALNTAVFPLIHCRRHPFEDETYQDACDAYVLLVPGSLTIFFGFPCGTTHEREWLPGVVKLHGFSRYKDKRAIKASMIGYAPLDADMVAKAYKFIIYSLHPVNRKIFMSSAVKDILGMEV